jgi:hypothetical protein
MGWCSTLSRSGYTTLLTLKEASGSRNYPMHSVGYVLSPPSQRGNPLQKVEAPPPRMQMLPRLKKLGLVNCPELRALPQQLGQEATSLKELLLRDLGSLQAVSEGLPVPLRGVVYLWVRRPRDGLEYSQGATAVGMLLPKFMACGGAGQFGAVVAQRGYAGRCFLVAVGA